MSIIEPVRYYLRDKNGEPMTGYSDIYDGGSALRGMPRGTELVRAEDGVVVSVAWYGNPMSGKAPHWGHRGH